MSMIFWRLTMFSGNFIPFASVELKDGFWQNRYQLNKNVSIESVKRRFEDSGRFDALRFNYLKTGKKPHFFFDSDVAKWIEGVSYVMEKDRESMKENEEFIDALILPISSKLRPTEYSAAEATTSFTVSVILSRRQSPTTTQQARKSSLK